MLPDRTYEKPPLVEVICDFYFDLNEDESWDPIRLAEVAEFVREKGFPSATTKRSRGPGPPRSSRQLSRHRRGDYDHRHCFASADGTKTVQVGENLLVVNQTPPYYGWTRFKEEVLDVLSLYLKTWPSMRIAYAGLHYVDNVEIPGATFYIDEYLKFYPVIPEELSKHALNNLVMAFEVEGSQPGDICTIHYQQRPSSDPDENSFRFRWDYISLEGFEPEPERAGHWLDLAHEFLHTAFRSAYTEKCEQLFLPKESP